MHWGWTTSFRRSWPRNARQAVLRKRRRWHGGAGVRNFRSRTTLRKLYDLIIVRWHYWSEVTLQFTMCVPFFGCYGGGFIVTKGLKKSQAQGVGGSLFTSADFERIPDS